MICFLCSVSILNGKLKNGHVICNSCTAKIQQLNNDDGNKTTEIFEELAPPSPNSQTLESDFKQTSRNYDYGGITTRSIMKLSAIYYGIQEVQKSIAAENKERIKEFAKIAGYQYGEYIKAFQNFLTHSPSKSNVSFSFHKTWLLVSYTVHIDRLLTAAATTSITYEWISLLDSKEIDKFDRACISVNEEDIPVIYSLLHLASN